MLTEDSYGLITVPHTATRATFAYLTPHVRAAARSLPYTVHVPGGHVYMHHCHKNAMDLIRRHHDAGLKILTTHRPLRDVKRTWTRKYGTKLEFRLMEYWARWLSEILPIAAKVFYADLTLSVQVANWVKATEGKQ